MRYMLKTYDIGIVGINDANQSANTALSDDSQFGGRNQKRPAVGSDVRFRQNDDVADATSGTVTYGEGRVSAVPTFGAGLVSFDPAPSSSIATPAITGTDNYTEALFLDVPLRWEDGTDHINDALTELGWIKRIVPLTDVADGDMISTATTNWTAGQGAETIAKNSATFNFPVRYLSVVGSVASQYARSASIVVEQGTSYYYEVCAMKTGANDASIQLYDVTNAAALTLENSTVDERYPIILANSLTLAATTEQIQVRLLKSDTGTTQGIAVVYVILRRNDARIFTIQDRPAKLLWLGELRQATGNNFIDRSWEAMSPVPAKAVQIDAGIWQYHLDTALPGRSLWYEEFVQPPVLTADSSTTEIEVEDLAAVTVERWLSRYKDLPQWATRYEKAAKKAAEVRMRRLHELQGTRQSSQYAIRSSGL